MGGVLLVRHTDVALRWQRRCYGARDVGLSRAGAAALAPLASALAAMQPAWVVHSGLSRASRLAERIAALAGCPLIEDREWHERDFGLWEGQGWAAIYWASGSAMDGMIDAPDSFRPGGGETTHELAERAARAWARLPAAPGIVVTHGGPIAALAGRLQGLPVRAWPGLVPPPGGRLLLTRHRAAAAGSHPLP